MKPVSRLIGGALIIATVLVPTRSGAHSAPRDSDNTISVSFVSPLIGWRLTQRWNQNTDKYGAIAIQRTNDGGSRWHFMSSLPAFPGARVLFADYRDGWAYGSRLYVTHDGGNTWRRISLHGSKTTLSLAGTNLWRLDSACRGRDNRCHLTLLESTTFTDTWRVLTRPPIAPGVATSIARAGPDAWIAGQVLSVTNRMHLALAATTDSGEMWHRLPMPCNRAGIGAFYADVVAYTSRNLWLFCASQPSAGSQGKAVFRTSDAGYTWRLVARSAVFAPHAGSRSVTGSGYLNDAAVISPRAAFIALSRDTLYRTTDGGRTWRAAIPVSVADPGGGSVGPVQFVDPRHGWLLSFPSLLFRTSDGGKSWRKIELP